MCERRKTTTTTTTTKEAGCHITSETTDHGKGNVPEHLWGTTSHMLDYDVLINSALSTTTGRWWVHCTGVLCGADANPREDPRRHGREGSTLHGCALVLHSGARESSHDGGGDIECV